MLKQPARPIGRYDDGQAEELLAELRRLPDGDRRRAQIRSDLAALHTSLARSIARRYAGGGEPVEDIEQAAFLGLVKAINNFNPERADRFVAYASPMMTGEVKRHFRDRTWTIRVPRRLQELRLELNHASQDFVRDHGRAPTATEIAELLEIDEEEAVEVIATADAYRPDSLDAPLADDESTSTLGALIGDDDRAFEAMVDGETLRPLIAELPERSRKILLLRFFGNKTQSEIGEEVGLSQMQVSRLLSDSLRRLREGMTREG